MAGQPAGDGLAQARMGAGSYPAAGRHRHPSRALMGGRYPGLFAAHGLGCILLSARLRRCVEKPPAEGGSFGRNLGHEETLAQYEGKPVRRKAVPKLASRSSSQLRCVRCGGRSMALVNLGVGRAGTPTRATALASTCFAPARRGGTPVRLRRASKLGPHGVAGPGACQQARLAPTHARLGRGAWSL